MKKFLSLLLINAVFIFLFAACVDRTPQNEPDTTSSPPSSTEVQPSEPASSDAYPVETRTQNSIISSDDGKRLITINLSLPSLSGGSEAVSNINAYYDNALDKLVSYAEYDLKPAAIEQLKINADQGLDFNEYSLSGDYAVTLNTKDYLSVSRELDYYTGGAHPGVTLNAETFDMSNGGLMNLSDVFSVSKETYMDIIYGEVIAQIEASDAKMDKSNFFEDYRERVKSQYDPADFYLSPDGITVFYQLYSIGPYVTGVQYYLIPYDKFDGMMKIKISES